jgi:hypothetical protein
MTKIKISCRTLCKVEFHVSMIPSENLSRNNYNVHTNLIGTQINYEENKEIIMGKIKDKS